MSIDLLPDTNVHINRVAGRLAPRARDAMGQVLLSHSWVALAELEIGIAQSDPKRSDWQSMQDHCNRLFASIPASRLLTPDAVVRTDAAVVVGTLARTQRLQPHQRKECLNDALIFLTAAKAGVPVLTAERFDFDLIQQIVPVADWDQRSGS